MLISTVKNAKGSEISSQFASSVIDFSSQYGRENSHSYTVSNLTYGPSRFPLYGDNRESCVLVYIKIYSYVSYFILIIKIKENLWPMVE